MEEGWEGGREGGREGPSEESGRDELTPAGGVCVLDKRSAVCVLQLIGSGEHVNYRRCVCVCVCVHANTRSVSHHKQVGVLSLLLWLQSEEPRPQSVDVPVNVCQEVAVGISEG